MTKYQERANERRSFKASNRLFPIRGFHKGSMRTGRETLQALFHSIGRPIRLGPDARDGRLTLKNGVKRRRRIRLGRPAVCLPETK